LAIEIINREGETWFCITNHDQLRPFFMNVVSDSNHWMFISSNGGLSAGRKNSEYALFPYYTDDKITESADITGSKTILQVQVGDVTCIWEPFSERNAAQYTITRNLYKSFYGNKIMFEETNHDLGLTYRYQWNSSNLHGFVRKSELDNHSGEQRKITLLDGLQNIMPYGIDPDLQTASSNLADAYKRSELIPESGLGIYALSAIIVDKAEPSEALKANVVWSLGLENPHYLLSSLQLNAFRNGNAVQPERDIKGEKGAYFTVSDIDMQADETKSWRLVANVNQHHAQIAVLDKAIREDADLAGHIEADIQKGTQTLIQLIAGADGLRRSADALKDARHFSNVLFNIMRGGTFDLNYSIEKGDLSGYLRKANREVFERNAAFLATFDDVLDKATLYEQLQNCKDADLYRLCKEYLPLKFSRRHGDPSRPWNKFSINTHSEIDGSKILDYEGNWRDIFQNWEALVHSYPGFIEGMIFKFLNTSTFDGYNPYRVTKGGFDWETIEPDNPWSYIGYWGDHQVIYLLKFLEFYHQHEPSAMQNLFSKEIFVYANVPYRIKSYAEIAIDPKNTIDFDEDLDYHIRTQVSQKGADGALLPSAQNAIYRVNFVEKILAMVLAKVSNFIPEGGIWMNTQRPEWNDANNALVGNGVSMVTLYYLRRFLKFFEEVLGNSSFEEAEISNELATFFSDTVAVLTQNANLLGSVISDADRKRVTQSLGETGSAYRTQIYTKGFSGEKKNIQKGKMLYFIKQSLEWLEHSIDANLRNDGLYHSYNIMTMNSDGIRIEHLSEMLEGQVAVLSSGYLKPDQAARVLDALRSSALYRSDQNSYMLYPNKNLPGFLQKNTISESAVARSPLLKKLVADGNTQLIINDVNGAYHFNGNFRTAGDVAKALKQLRESGYQALVSTDADVVLQIFEEVFNHKAFTGRSGTFFAYEGLGSIYWHMVSKLHLAVEEVCQQAIKADYPCYKGLLQHFYTIGDGIGVHKAPKLYGAFPTDPYSHTPWHRGAQQPGMTGQVKEDILVSIGELGIESHDGMLQFQPRLLRKAEFTSKPVSLEFVNVHQQTETIDMPAASLCFSYAQVPVIYQISERDQIRVIYRDGKESQVDGLKLDKNVSSTIFARKGEIQRLHVTLRDQHMN
jgi:hypothetical protein